MKIQKGTMAKRSFGTSIFNLISVNFNYPYMLTDCQQLNNKIKWTKLRGESVYYHCKKIINLAISHWGIYGYSRNQHDVRFNSKIVFGWHETTQRLLPICAYVVWLYIFVGRSVISKDDPWCKFKRHDLHQSCSVERKRLRSQ